MRVAGFVEEFAIHWIQSVYAMLMLKKGLRPEKLA
jgi:hypothetical protein